MWPSDINIYLCLWILLLLLVLFVCSSFPVHCVWKWLFIPFYFEVSTPLFSFPQFSRKVKFKAHYWKKACNIWGCNACWDKLRKFVASRLGAVLSIELTWNGAWCALSLNCASWHRPHLPGSQLKNSLDIQRSSIQSVCPGMMTLWSLTKALP